MIKNRSTLEKDKAILREISLNDTDFVVALRNNDDIRRWFTNPEKITAEGHIAFVKKYFSDENSDEIYIIEYDGRKAGMISLYNFSDDKAEWGRIMVDPGFQGKGIGKKALLLIIERAKHLGVKTLYCYVKMENQKAIGFYKNVGFACDGEKNDELRMIMTLR